MTRRVKTILEAPGMREILARAIAAEIAAQSAEYVRWEIKTNLTIDYLDQGEVDFGRVADAAVRAILAAIKENNP